MIEKLKQFFTLALGEDSAALQQNSEEAKRLAAVALMIEIIAVDDERHDSEINMLRSILKNQFSVADTVIDKLINDAENAHHDATDYYRFAQDINASYSADQKVGLIEDFWRLAWADGHIDELEQHVIRKLSRLLYVSHSDFIAAKLRVIDSGKS